MNFPFLIAKRISKSSTSGSSGSLIKIAISTISLSIAVMLLATSVIKGFKNGVSNKIYGFWGNIHVTDTHASRSFELRPIVNDIAIKDSIISIGYLEYNAGPDNENVKMMRTKGGVRSISPFITFPGILNRKTEMEGIVLKGINHEFNQEPILEYIKEGGFPELTDSVTSRGILISRQTASRLDLKLDDKVNIHFLRDNNNIKRSLKVAGIFRTGLEEYDRKFAFVDMRFIQQLLDWNPDQISGYEILVDHVEDSPVIADYVYSEILPSNMYAETIQEKQSSIFQWLELQNINETVALLLMGLVAIINMITVLLILILERSKMIGILKAIGQNDWELRKIFIYSALFILGMALIFGNILGLGIGFLQQKFGFLKLDETNYYLSQVPIEFDLWSIVAINIGAIVVTAIVMILPTFLVTRISPIEILRFE